jgi:hypothetical protein
VPKKPALHLSRALEPTALLRKKAKIAFFPAMLAAQQPRWVKKMSTSLPNPETEKKFEEYRRYLIKEAIYLASLVALFRKLYERRVDRLEEMNIAPAFFQVVTEAVLSTIILWVDKLFDERGKYGIFDFLVFIENNRNILTVEQLKRRKNYPDGHWMLNRKPITLETIQQDRERIRSLDCLQNCSSLRDKFYAHFDKK